MDRERMQLKKCSSTGDLTTIYASKSQINKSTSQIIALNYYLAKSSQKCLSQNLELSFSSLVSLNIHESLSDCKSDCCDEMLYNESSKNFQD